MGFLKRFRDAKFNFIGDKIAYLIISVNNMDYANKMLTECNFSSVYKIRFKFDFMLAGFCVVSHAVRASVQNEEIAEKIAIPIYTSLDNYLETLIPGKIRIGDFIANDDEWDYLKNNHHIDNPNMITDYKRFFHVIGSYRAERLDETFHAGFDLFDSKTKNDMEKEKLLAMCPLAEMFALNFPTTNENNYRNLIHKIPALFSLIYFTAKEICEQNA